MTTTTVVRQRKLDYKVATYEREMNDFIPSIDGNLSFASLEKASPSQQGKVLKLHVPLFYSLVPSFLLGILRYCPSSLNPSWKERNLVILGNYIYRFYNELSKSIKGSPTCLDGIDAQLFTKQTTGIGSTPIFQGADFGGVFLKELPPFCNAVFSIRSIDKTRYYAVESEEDAVMWVNSIREGRQECIKRKMGHAEHVPYPRSWEHFDRLGDQAVKQHARIKENVARHERRETEMSISSLGDGPNARGYYS
mmetsp:Transcript_24282/g.28606  ORF Transcript_24282/g.28606 Transcript_24282/m.28606 type:complete len:251 (+) Transcript_24282:122-874(+)|eukprot:CAMPEP_0198253650 /NCGR_PEP_ID=MMETSP1447-20131203/4056_1 /TAXON_ID=420782 /ORGANISM="Chaetoceros dichaeta, Strain CCMP1751" /LENGTH=250 /DNA_ID=CAMNT_0043939411 /DNA_START=71 /DNA_END=823 /DNA_ORIENTATION=-